MVPLIAIYVNPWWLAFIVIVAIALITIVTLLIVRTYEKKVTTGKEDMVGRTAVVRTKLDPKGEVFIDDELWKAEIDKGTAGPEDEVIITRVQDLKLFVTKK